MAKQNKPIRLTKSNTRKYSSSSPSHSSSVMKTKPSSLNYKKFLSERDFLKVAKRASMVQGWSLSSIDFAGNELRFLVNSVTRPGIKYTIIVQVNPIDKSVMIDKKAKLYKILQDAGLKIFCSCPAWGYFGYSYKAWRQGYGIFPETRYPHIRNPHLRGFVCKHLHYVMRLWPFLSRQIAKQFRDYWTKEQLEQIDDAIEYALKGIKIDF